MNAFFYIFATMLLIGGLNVVFSKNSVYSVLSLIFVFINAAGIMILEGASYMAMMILIVYVGAVAILFLFVIMMLNVESVLKKNNSGNVFKSIVFGFTLAFNIALLVFCYMWNDNMDVTNIVSTGRSDIKMIGMTIYTDMFIQFHGMGLILMTAMIGSIALTIGGGSSNVKLKKQDPYKQISRTKENSIYLTKITEYQGTKND